MNSVISEDVKPVKIPPEYVQYAEKHNIYDLTQRILNDLIINRPEDPISYLIDYLNKDIGHVPSIFLFGPISSGKKTLAGLLSAKLKCVVITEDDVYQLSPSGRKTNPKQLALLLKERLRSQDCVEKGYIIVGFPTHEGQAKALGWEGVYPEYAVFLQASPQVLLEREQGKRLDPVTGTHYHLYKNPPSDTAVEKRLVPLPDHTPDVTLKSILDYNYKSVLLEQFYAPVAKKFNADQHLTDIHTSVLAFVQQPRRNVGLRTPRVILLGFVGSGRKTQAKRLAEKYNLVVIDCGELLRRQMENSSTIGKEMKTYVAREMPVPDAMVIESIKPRLIQDDCSTRGWVLIGYPRSKVQAELLDAAGLSPDRVFMLHIPQACAAERLTGRRVDPVTGIHYHVQYKPYPELLSERALQNPDDEDCVIGPKLARFAAHREELTEYYSEKLVHVQASNSPHTVFEEIEAGLVNPLPRKEK